jgi:mannose-6-phosphate isomerase-like protein (cupin superfamily)
MKVSVQTVDAVEPFRLPNRTVREVFSAANGLASGCAFRTVDVDPSDPESPRVPHVHDRMEEIIVVAHGQGALWLDGEWMRVSGGDAWIVPAGVPHATVNIGDESLRLYCFFSAARPEADYPDRALTPRLDASPDGG